MATSGILKFHPSTKYFTFCVVSNATVTILKLSVFAVSMATGGILKFHPIPSTLNGGYFEIYKLQKVLIQLCVRLSVFVVSMATAGFLKFPSIKAINMHAIPHFY